MATSSRLTPVIDAVARATTGRAVRVRRARVARGHIRGDGLEIGALHLPLALPQGVTVRYVDRLDTAGLRREYPELSALDLVDVEVVDDGERLETVPEGSVDFVIANHFIEHCENLFGTLRRQADLVRPGGTIFLAVPDRRRTFDRNRPAGTTLEHHLADAREGPEAGRRRHFEDWARYVEGAADGEVPARADALQASGYSIHFHAWTRAELARVLEEGLPALGIPLELAAVRPSWREFIVVLRRTP